MSNSITSARTNGSQAFLNLTLKGLVQQLVVLVTVSLSLLDTIEGMKALFTLTQLNSWTFQTLWIPDPLGSSSSSQKMSLCHASVLLSLPWTRARSLSWVARFSLKVTHFPMSLLSTSNEGSLTTTLLAIKTRGFAVVRETKSLWLTTRWLL